MSNFHTCSAFFFAFEKSTDAGCFLRLRRASEVDAIGQMPVPVRMAWQWPLQWSWIRPQPEVNDGWLVIARQWGSMPRSASQEESSVLKGNYVHWQLWARSQEYLMGFLGIFILYKGTELLDGKTERVAVHSLSLLLGARLSAKLLVAHGAHCLSAKGWSNGLGRREN